MNQPAAFGLCAPSTSNIYFRQIQFLSLEAFVAWLPARGVGRWAALKISIVIRVSSARAGTVTEAADADEMSNVAKPEVRLQTTANARDMAQCLRAEVAAFQPRGVRGWPSHSQKTTRHQSGPGHTDE